MPKLPRHTLPWVLLMLLVILVASFRSFFMVTIIEPIAIVFWAAWRMVASVDQNVYWLVLILACSILVIRLIPTGNDRHLNQAYRDPSRPSPRVEHWRTLIMDAMIENEKADALHDQLKKLLAATLSERVGSGSLSAETIVVTGKTPLSHEAYRFLFSTAGNEHPFWKRINIMVFLPGFLRRWATKFSAWDTHAVDEILSWMETEMEITHDQSDRNGRNR